MSIEYYQISNGQVCEQFSDLKNIEQLSFYYKDENTIVLEANEISDSVIFQLNQTPYLFVVINYFGGKYSIQYPTDLPFNKDHIIQLELVCS